MTRVVRVCGTRPEPGVRVDSTCLNPIKTRCKLYLAINEYRRSHMVYLSGWDFYEFRSIYASAWSDTRLVLPCGKWWTLWNHTRSGRTIYVGCSFVDDHPLSIYLTHPQSRSRSHRTRGINPSYILIPAHTQILNLHRSTS